MGETLEVIKFLVKDYHYSESCCEKGSVGGTMRGSLKEKLSLSLFSSFSTLLLPLPYPEVSWENVFFKLFLEIHLISTEHWKQCYLLSVSTW